jgi:hypothetical protein
MLCRAVVNFSPLLPLSSVLLLCMSWWALLVSIVYPVCICYRSRMRYHKNQLRALRATASVEMTGYECAHYTRNNTNMHSRVEESGTADKRMGHKRSASDSLNELFNVLDDDEVCVCKRRRRSDKQLHIADATALLSPALACATIVSGICSEGVQC